MIFPHVLWQVFSQLPGPGDSVQDSGANIVFPTIWADGLCARLGRQHCFSNYLDRATLCKTRAPTMFFQLSGPGSSLQDSGANIVFPTIWTGRLVARLGRQQPPSLAGKDLGSPLDTRPHGLQAGPLALHVAHLTADLGVRQAFFGVEVVRPDSHHWVEAARVDNRLDQDHGERRGGRACRLQGKWQLEHARKLLDIHR